MITITVFEDYHRAQTTFIQTISELAYRSKNIEYLQQEGWYVSVKISYLNDPYSDLLTAGSMNYALDVLLSFTCETRCNGFSQTTVVGYETKHSVYGSNGIRAIGGKQHRPCDWNRYG